MAKLLDGKIIRDKIAQDLESRVKNLDSCPRLVIIQVGDNPESNSYITQKIKFGELIGANVKLVKLPEDVTEKTINYQLSTFNSERSINGIIVQMPIPKNLNKETIIEMIDPKKDVDGQTAANIKKLTEGSNHVIASETKQSQEQIATDSSSPRNDRSSFPGFIPATTKGILTMLAYYKIPVSGKHVVIVGRSSLVGKPTALAMLNLDATVTVCHSKTQNLQTITKSADVLIVAAGKPKLITKDHVSPNQTVIDVGINVISPYSSSESSLTRRVEKFEDSSRQVYTERIRSARTINSENDKPESEPAGRKLIGDVDFDEVSKIVSAISPVPGGVGPLTVASLFENLLDACNNQTK